jgi:hypothetical protein
LVKIRQEHVVKNGKKEKLEYVEYLLEKFGSKENAIGVVDELLKIAPLGSMIHDLKDVKNIINNY